MAVGRGGGLGVACRHIPLSHNLRGSHVLIDSLSLLQLELRKHRYPRFILRGVFDAEILEEVLSAFGWVSTGRDLLDLRDQQLSQGLYAM